MGSKLGGLKTGARALGVSLEEYIGHIESGEKHCGECRKWLPLICFHKDKSRTDGRASICMVCRQVPDPYASLRGRVSTFKGKKHSAEAKAKMSKARIGNKNRVGAKHTQATKDYISYITRKNTPRGKNHPAYKHGNYQRTLESRRSPEYTHWRRLVFVRDGYTCQYCGDDTGGNLNPHHLALFSEAIALRFEVDNGITLCEECHKKQHRRRQ